MQAMTSFIRRFTLPAKYSTLPGSSVAQFLVSVKQAYLRDVREGNGGKWTVAMGNEAGGKLCKPRKSDNPNHVQTLIHWLPPYRILGYSLK